MKQLFFILAFIPLLGFSQSKKKRLKAAQEAKQALVARLTSHVRLLASDSMQGRLAGSAGEQMALEYLVNHYRKCQIEPKGSNEYVQKFTIESGKKIHPATSLIINKQPATLQQHFFPLAYSACKSVTNEVAMSLNESGNIWFKDLKDCIEDNQDNPHFSITETLKNQVQKATSRGATALIIYNSGTTPDRISFDKNDTTTYASIPVIYLTSEGLHRFFADQAALQEVTLNVKLETFERTANNVLAFIDNKAPNTVVIGAHYDHLGFGEDNNALDTLHQVHNGADDNASGTAALLELAPLLKTSTYKNNNYLLAHFSGEELGLLGSKYWLKNSTINTPINYMINMDMIGRYDTTHQLMLGGLGTSPQWGDIIKTIEHNSLRTKIDSTGAGPSDHASFYRAGIPVLFLFTGLHADYHKTTDDAALINYESMADVVAFVHQLIGNADGKGKLGFAKTKEPTINKSAKYTVSLGVMPDYSFSGKGLRIDGVSTGKPAEKIGLKAGDVLLQLGNYPFGNIYEYMEVLSKFAAGDHTELVFERNGTKQTVAVQF